MQVSAFIKACQEQIDILKNSINNEEANSRGWLGMMIDKSNADTAVHKHGVVRVILFKYQFLLIILFLYSNNTHAFHDQN